MMTGDVVAGDPGLRPRWDWRQKALGALVVAVTSGLVGVELYGDTASDHVPTMLVSFDAVYTVQSLERFMAAVVLTVSAIAWAVFLTILCTAVVLDTIASWQLQHDRTPPDPWAEPDADNADLAEA
jgi:hypothetical protein